MGSAWQQPPAPRRYRVERLRVRVRGAAGADQQQPDPSKGQTGSNPADAAAPGADQMDPQHRETVEVMAGASDQRPVQGARAAGCYERVAPELRLVA